ncbi:MAG: hypothetical protein JWN02_685 [Acidobacteria bacterium]|nr:hypothetical protein [Acidobacteriota bacterium]
MTEPNYATEERFREVFNTIEPYIERRYEVPVLIRDVPDPFTGDLDGEHIEVDYDQSWEDALFIIAHLFGHTVQWNLSARAREIGTAAVKEPSEEFLAELADYERQACRYSLQLFHDAGIHDLDQWMADFAACDSGYLMHFYRTGEKRPFRTFWKVGTLAIGPLPLPHFQPTRWVSRADGVVV